MKTQKKQKQKQKQKKATQKTKKMSNMDTNNKIGMNPDVSEVLAIPSVEWTLPWRQTIVLIPHI